MTIVRLVNDPQYKDRLPRLPRYTLHCFKPIAAGAAAAVTIKFLVDDDALFIYLCHVLACVDSTGLCQLLCPLFLFLILPF